MAFGARKELTRPSCVCHENAHLLIVIVESVCCYNLRKRVHDESKTEKKRHIVDENIVIGQQQRTSSCLSGRMELACDELWSVAFRVLGHVVSCSQKAGSQHWPRAP